MSSFYDAVVNAKCMVHGCPNGATMVYSVRGNNNIEYLTYCGHFGHVAGEGSSWVGWTNILATTSYIIPRLVPYFHIDTYDL